MKKNLSSKKGIKLYLLGSFLLPVLIMLYLFIIGNYVEKGAVPEGITLYENTTRTFMTPFICTEIRGEVLYGEYCNILQIVFDPWHIFFTIILTLILIVPYLLIGVVIFGIHYFIKLHFKNN